jgi:hypothetical protein
VSLCLRSLSPRSRPEAPEYYPPIPEHPQSKILRRWRINTLTPSNLKGQPYGVFYTVSQSSLGRSSSYHPLALLSTPPTTILPHLLKLSAQGLPLGSIQRLQVRATILSPILCQPGIPYEGTKRIWEEDTELYSKHPFCLTHMEILNTQLPLNMC